MKCNWLWDHIHISWLFAFWCLGITIGIITVAGSPHGLFIHWGWLLFGVVLSIVVCIFRRGWVIPLAIMAGLIIGVWRGSIGQIGLDKYQSLYGKSMILSGRVLEDPDIDKKGQTVLRLADVTVEWQKLPGTIWVVTRKNSNIKRSDIVTVQGKIAEGFGVFSARMSRAQIHKIERPVPGDVAVGARDWFAGRVRLYLPETASALGMGFLTGLRRALPPDLAEALKIAGLTHVIVASGYNLTILVRLSRRLFAKTSKYLSALSATAMTLGFMALTGLSPSMSRAGLVTGMSLATWYYGRTIHPLVLLPAAAAITLLINPAYGWGDLGWQLSFAAFAGVMLLAPLLQRYFFGDKKPGIFRQILGETLSAQIMTLPILVLSFGVISNVALIANILILPLVPMAMFLTFLVGVLADIPFIAEIVSVPTEWLLKYMVSVADWLAGQSWVQTEVSIQWWQALGGYVLLGLAMWWMQRQTKLALRDVNVVE